MAAARARPRTNGPFQGHLRALLELGPFQDSYAPPVPPPWHRVTATWRALCASALTTPRLLWRPPSPVSPAGSCLKRGSSPGISYFPCGGPDDDGIIDADDDASMDGDSASSFSRSRVTTATVAGRSWVRRRPSKGFPCRHRLSPPYLTICRASAFAPRSASRRVTPCSRLCSTAAGGDPSTLKAPVSEGDPSPGASTGSASLSGRRMAP